MSENLISLDPPSVLIFQLERGIQSKATLTVTNTSNKKIIFKVKTTQPTWYYVRPNQQILEAGRSEEVAVLLIDTECNRFLDQAEKNAEEKLDKLRFLVQSKPIDDAVYNKIIETPAAQRTDEFTKIWEDGTHEKRNIKLKVEFRYPPKAQPNSEARRQTITGDNASNIRNRLARRDSDERSGIELSSSSPEVILVELQTLRKKYDAVVEYTVHLTAERDTIVTQLENTQRELFREKSKKIANNSKGEKKVIEKGFSLFVVLFAATVFFLLGRYIR